MVGLKAAAQAPGQRSLDSFFGKSSGSAAKQSTAQTKSKPAKKATKAAPKKAAKRIQKKDDLEESSEAEDAASIDNDQDSDYKAAPADEASEEGSSDEGEEEVEEDTMDIDDDASDLVEDKPSKKSKGKGKAKEKGPEVDPASSPPIHKIPAIFRDLVGRAPGMKEVAERLKGRKMRVATMCSGTESPLLALDLIRRSMVDLWGTDLEWEHVFSCEIEPFKQAYIERNFSPPLLFRDVCELGDGVAYTAYGALAVVPGDVDLLVAGTSCVDYSNLNNEKKDIEDNGESGRTFRGMMGWVKIHRPPLVILENVCGAPWDKVEKFFEKIDYSASHLRVDTKKFYIPHTRTRVYLLAVDRRRCTLPDDWLKMIERLKRPASCSLDAFLLPTDDPRIHQARERLVRESYNAVDRKTGRTDWTRCESRHHRARLEENLGQKRPLTTWEDGGHCKLPDFAWNDWGIGQVERVWDLMDILLLRSAKTGVDPSFKTIVWNLSQNVDRNVGTGKLGTCPCLTPSMIPYITNRGGPMVGIEALSMQGLPVDELLLTRETEDQLADLAGNAMSTTVVGACIISALIVGRKLLKAGNDTQAYEEKNQNVELVGEDDVEDTLLQIDTLRLSSSTTQDISGEDQLVQKPLDLTAGSEISLPQLLADAQSSSRLCQCEGRKDMTDRVLNRCIDCGSSSCVKCGGRPEHNYAPIDIAKEPRLSPSTFARTLKSVLPMALQLTNVTEDLLTSLREGAGKDISEDHWTGWSEAVLRVAKQELRFVEPKRQEIWVATYQSSVARLELSLHPKRPEWHLFAKPEESEPANSEIRKLLEAPVGRLVCDGGLFKGTWQWALPDPTTISLTVEGSELVPSWEAKLGLQEKELAEKKVHSQLEISVAEGVEKLDRDISGTYVLLDKCGTANAALHKRTSPEGEENLPPIFMLLDPSRCGNPSEDAFVFSISIRRYEYGETRPIIASLAPKWRQSAVEGKQTVKCHIPYQWVDSSEVCLTAAPDRQAFFSVPGATLNVDVAPDSCRSANAILVCQVPLHEQAGPEWGLDDWKEVDKVHERSIFKSLSWLTERVRNDSNFTEWQDATLHGTLCHCERCAPKAPEIQWARNKKHKIVAVENTRDAGKFEHALKRRPAPFVTQLKVDKHHVGHVRLGINIPSLMHRAYARLPSEGRTEDVRVAWRLNTDFAPIAKLNLPKFTLKSNKKDTEAEQPPSFETWPLRPEQLRSLTWMIAQEAPDAPPFVEEEISEAILEPLGWRVEGRAQRDIHVRGGVLADQVGYGKTAITLGLIDSTAKEVKRRFSKMGDMPGKIPVRATLVVVPPHLTLQWGKEIKKFTGETRFNQIILSSASTLNSLTIEKVQKADIIIVASNLFKSPVYLQNLAGFAAGGSLPEKQEGRYFNARLEKVLEALGKQVDLLKEGEVKAVHDNIREAARTGEEEEVVEQTKRLKGKRYVEKANESEKAKTKEKKSVVQLKSSTKTKTKQPTHSEKAKPRNGMIVEVVVPLRSKDARRSMPSSPVSSPAEELDEDGSDAPVARRKSKKKVIVISDDDEAAQSEAVSDDYEPSSKALSSDEMEVDGEEKPKKGKKAAKANGKAAKKAASDSEDADAMEVDDAPKKSKGKRKTPASSDDESAKRPAKKARVDADPWHLKGKVVQKDWTQMQAPPLEMFYFARTVVDEYTYLEGKVHSMVTHLAAERRWVLSGTPPLSDFGAIKTISAFLGVHLGIDDDGEGESAKKRKREQTDVEKFHSFREVHSLEWHTHRHQLGQMFLDRYVRQNIAEIDEIPCTFHIKEVNLPAAERAIYLELEHYLRALDMTVKRSRKSESDREKRLAQALGESSSAEEALLKRCSHFDLETNLEDNAMKACEVIVKEREKQLKGCETELSKKLKEALAQQKAIGATGEESLFQEYVRVTYSDEGLGDTDAREKVVKLFEERGIKTPSGSSTAQVNGNKGKGKAKGKDDGLTEKQLQERWEHRELAHEIRRITKELVGRVRSLRYFQVVRDLQKESRPTVDCPACKRKDLPIEDIAVLSSCGHMGCLTCVKEMADKEECVHGSGQCGAAARSINVVEGQTLGVDDIARDANEKHYGRKLEMIIDLIKNHIPEKKRVLIFVQFPDLMKKVAEALGAHGIKYLEIKGSAAQKSKNLEKFQNASPERVLLLNVMDESASGANLTGANHAIFLSPLLAPSQEIYDACETQAIGRLRRYGQRCTVNIWRFISLNTIDVQIIEERSHKTVAELKGN